jgi:hypothetical protein
MTALDIRAHNEALGQAGVWVGEAVALASERALSSHDRETLQTAGRLLVMLIRSQVLAEGPPPS